MTAHGSHTYSGNYTTYLDHKNEVKVEKEKNISYLEQKKSQSETRKQQNQIKKIEKQISELEIKISQYNESLHDEEILNDYQKYNEIIKCIDDSQHQLEQLLETWEELQS